MRQNMRGCVGYATRKTTKGPLRKCSACHIRQGFPIKQLRARFRTSVIRLAGGLVWPQRVLQRPFYESTA